MEDLQPRDLERIQSLKKEGEEDPFETNVTAALAVSEILHTALGPSSKDKMLVNDEETVITDSGGTILQTMELVHPAAKMMAQLGTTQREHYGDGTTSSVILGGELLRKALELYQAGLHPTIIVSGYQKALGKSLEFLDKVATGMEQKHLDRVGLGMLEGKVAGDYARHLVEVAHAAVNLVRGEKERIYINYRPGGNINQSEAFDGVYIDLGKRAHPSMPRSVKNARILLINTEFDLTEAKNSKVEINSPQKYREFVEYKKKVLKAATSMVARSGANVVLCSKNIASEAMFFLAQEGILGVRDVEKEVMQHLSEATGARVVGNVKEVTPETLGYAGYVEESKIGREEIMYIKKPQYPNRVASVLIRAGSENLALELVRKMEDIVEVLSRVAGEKKMLPGGGAVEVELAERLRLYSRKVGSREQIAVEAFASALEEIPRLLAKSVGLNPIDVLASIKRGHYAGFTGVGFNVLERKVQDNLEKGIFDSYAVKKNALVGATETANSIIRIDDVIVQGNGEVKEQVSPQPPQQQPSPEKFDLRQAFKDLR